MLDLFDAAESEKRKRFGMELAANNRPGLLRLARALAFQIAVRNGTVTADDVIRLLARDYGVTTLGNAAGSLFTGGDFVWTGEFKKSERVQAHSNLLRVWRLDERVR